MYDKLQEYTKEVRGIHSQLQNLPDPTLEARLTLDRQIAEAQGFLESLKMNPPQLSPLGRTPDYEARIKRLSQQKQQAQRDIPILQEELARLNTQANNNPARAELESELEVAQKKLELYQTCYEAILRLMYVSGSAQQQAISLISQQFRFSSDLAVEQKNQKFEEATSSLPAVIDGFLAKLRTAEHPQVKDEATANTAAQPEIPFVQEIAVIQERYTELSEEQALALFNVLQHHFSNSDLATIRSEAIGHLVVEFGLSALVNTYSYPETGLAILFWCIQQENGHRNLPNDPRYLRLVQGLKQQSSSYHWQKLRAAQYEYWSQVVDEFFKLN